MRLGKSARQSIRSLGALIIARVWLRGSLRSRFTTISIHGEESGTAPPAARNRRKPDIQLEKSDVKFDESASAGAGPRDIDRDTAYARWFRILATSRVRGKNAISYRDVREILCVRGGWDLTRKRIDRAN